MQPLIYLHVPPVFLGKAFVAQHRRLRHPSKNSFPKFSLCITRAASTQAPHVGFVKINLGLITLKWLTTLWPFIDVSKYKNTYISKLQGENNFFFSLAASIFMWQSMRNEH